MANKTATLKNQAGDNIYPNIVGDNRNAAIKDSTTIKHTLAENKISLDLDETVKGKIDAALQKPTGLTKTKLVGVGANGQENIEIGDNLTLANGKLSATGGGSGGGDFEYLNVSEDFSSFTGDYTGTKPVIYEVGGVKFLLSQQFATFDGSKILVLTNPIIIGGSQTVYSISDNRIDTQNFYLYYSHFITMTNSTDNVALYLTINNTSEDTFTADTLASYLADKKVLANGNLHGVVPTYIAVEGGVIKIYYRTPGDSNINPTPDEYQDLSSFTITDLVKPVE